MTKTLKELELEHPEWCFRCGHREMSAPFHSCYPAHVINILTAAKREDEARIAELEKRAEFFASLDHAWAVGMQEKNDALQSQLTAERQAHEETKRQLDSMTVTMGAINRMANAEDTDMRHIIRETALARQSQRAADAAKERGDA